MKPGYYDFYCQPGATLVGKVFVCLDENYDPVNIVGMLPMAKVRLSPTDPVILDLNPSVIAPDPLPAVVSVVAGSQVFTSVGHGLMAGMSLTFKPGAGPGALPTPLRTNERYIVLTKNITADTFTVISFRAALFGTTAPLRITSSGNCNGTLSHGQIKIPEVADEITDTLAEADALWDLMLQDGAGRRLAPLAKGSFFIHRGQTP